MLDGAWLTQAGLPAHASLAMREDRLGRIGPLLALALFLHAALPVCLPAADSFEQQIQPFVERFCFECHAGKDSSADLDLSAYQSTSDVVASFHRWSHVIEFLRDGEMPPKKAEQPTSAEREAAIKAIEKLLLAEARKHAGDPGVVLPRRLSNTEYDLSIRDLTGVDIRATANFPADPAGGEGFDNTGEALSMSPSLVKKYLEAAQHVAAHLVLKTDGIAFAPFSVTSYNERAKFAEEAIISFYTAHDVDPLVYLEAAWRYRYRSSDEQSISSAQWAKDRGLSEKYLALVWQTLEPGDNDSVGYLHELRQKWRDLPQPQNAVDRPEAFEQFLQYFRFCRAQLCHKQGQLIKSDAGNWPIQHLAFRAKEAAKRDQFISESLTTRKLIRFEPMGRLKRNNETEVIVRLRVSPAFAGSGKGLVVVHRPLFSKSDNLPRNEQEEKEHEVVTLRSFLDQHAPDVAKRLGFGSHSTGVKLDADSFAMEATATVEIPLNETLIAKLADKHLLLDCELNVEHAPEAAVHVQSSTRELPADTLADGILLLNPDSRLAEQFTAAGKQFTAAFPNRFCYVDGDRGLAAGFHLVEGSFRDDRPLMEKVVTDQQREEIDVLWRELHFGTQSAETLLRGFVWFERSEREVLHDTRFDFLRPEDPQLVEPEMLARFERVYLEKLGVKLPEGASAPVQPNEQYVLIHGFFEEIRAGLLLYQQQLQAAEKEGLADLERVTERAYRRPLRQEEKTSLNDLYSRLRKQGQSVEQSLRGVFTAVLMSPEFFYRVQPAQVGTEIHPLDNDALASRLSYFLWSSPPDDALLQAAHRGELQDESNLIAQTRRMLKDERVEALAREFFGQWLRYRDYLAKDPINAATFPGYDDELRQAMFDEPTRLAAWLIQEDRPVTELLDSDITFVNGRLANHYGGEIARQYQDQSRVWEEKFKAQGQKSPMQPEQRWLRVAGLRAQGRGGLFGMAVILTKNSAGERTSPIKRGFWTVHHLLGKHFPPPPADVPELPPGEKQAQKTIRELIAAHTDDQKCAICHRHFDSLGMAMEGFDPIGRSRSQDLAGRPIDNVAVLPNGDKAEGVTDLIDYIRDQRRDEFVHTLCRKFLGYALGRSVILSDEPLLAEMQAELEKNDYRFSVLFETVVRSPQFRTQRGQQ